MTYPTYGAALLLSAALLAVAPSARAETEDQDRLLLIGGGAYVASNPYATAKKKIQTGALPFFVYEKGRLTADLSGLSVRTIGNSHFTLEGRVSPRIAFVDPKDTRDFRTLKRDSGVDLGARLSASSGPATLSIEYLRDISGATKGQEINTDLTLTAQPIESLSLSVVAGLSWKDEALANWMFGLTEKEVGRARAYQFGKTVGAPSGGVLVPSLGVQGRYTMNDRLAVIVAARIEVYDNDVTDSPLIAKDHATSGFVAVVRRF